MRASASCAALVMCVALAQAGDYCPPACVPIQRPAYACTEPAPPSRFPPVHIPNPFACDGPNCDPAYGGNPFGQGPIPLPPPPGAGTYGTQPYGTFPYGANPYGTNPYGPYGPSPFGSAPGTGTSPLTPRDRAPRFQDSRTIAGITRSIEETQPLCKVSFWNHTAGELTLFIGDRMHRVQKDRAIVLPLPREFTWKTDLHPDKLVQVPGDLNYFDVVIR